MVATASHQLLMLMALSYILASTAATRLLFEDDVCPRIITRAEWDARQPKNVTNITLPVPKLFIHHTAGAPCTDQTTCTAIVRSIQDFHMDDRGWDDIGYQFLVGEDGNVYEGRGWDHVGAQVRHYNFVSFGFSMIGTFDYRLPNSAALNAVTQLIACARQLDKTKSNYTLHGHRDGGCTDCPGQMLYEHIQSWPHYGGVLPRNCTSAASRLTSTRFLSWSWWWRNRL